MAKCHIGVPSPLRGVPISVEHRLKISASKRAQKRRHTEETKLLMSINLKGKNAGINCSHYIADRSLLKTARKKAYDTRYKYWMKEVKNRDGWRCKISNSDCSGRLEAHHILRWQDYPELRYQVNNGISLCRFHHPLKREEEDRLSPYFIKLVGVKVN